LLDLKDSNKTNTLETFIAFFRAHESFHVVKIYQGKTNILPVSGNTQCAMPLGCY
jgi:hypothetical protein